MHQQSSQMSSTQVEVGQGSKGTRTVANDAAFFRYFDLQFCY